MKEYMKKRIIFLFLGCFLAAQLMMSGCANAVQNVGDQSRLNMSVQETEETTDEAEFADMSQEAEKPSYFFRNDKLLTQHYEKHGIEMGFASKEEYEQAASDVITNPDALYKVEAEDGDGVYYVEETNEFAILSTDGYIRTYFLPDKGIDYFNRQ